MMDLTKYQESAKTKTIIVTECTVRMDKKSMLEALLSSCIKINGGYFEVPEKQLLMCLINEEYGETTLKLKKIG